RCTIIWFIQRGQQNHRLHRLIRVLLTQFGNTCDERFRIGAQIFVSNPV
ncbi:hypothetical protein PSYPI_40089, partial [Pseudomonas syringae pv. pisi str. 1704B]